MAAPVQGRPGRRRRSADRPWRESTRRWPNGRWTTSWPGPRPTTSIPSLFRRPAALVSAGTTQGTTAIERLRAACVAHLRAEDRRALGAAGRLAPRERRSPAVVSTAPSWPAFSPIPSARPGFLRPSKPTAAMSRTASDRAGATSTRRPIAAAGPTAWYAPRTRPATNGAPSSAGRIFKDLALLTS